ncbi:MAG TPA: hypothetical protein VK304_00500, partial [Thermoleophilaceae bacterium]|nr:hypothetical protein [Thermoleophilaceae bacterium]
PAPSLVYQIDTAKVTGDTGEEITTARMALIGESDAGAHDLLRGRGDEEQVTAIEEAEHFLRVELADGPRPAREIEAEAAKIGITKTTLFRARKQLGVKPNKAGFSGGWEWALPEDSNPPEPEVESSEAESSENPAPDAGLRLVEPSQDSTPSTLESSGSEGASPEAIPAADEAEIRAFERRLEEARRASR